MKSAPAPPLTTVFVFNVTVDLPVVPVVSNKVTAVAPAVKSVVKPAEPVTLTVANAVLPVMVMVATLVPLTFKVVAAAAVKVKDVFAMTDDA